MKKLLLTGIAALFLLPGAAHTEHAARLPSKMLGKWCSVREDPHRIWVYKQVDSWEGCNISRLMLSKNKYWEQDGNSGPMANCRIIGPITLLEAKEHVLAKPNPIFQARYRCKSSGFSWIEHTTMYLDENAQLVKQGIMTK